MVSLGAHCALHLACSGRYQGNRHARRRQAIWQSINMATAHPAAAWTIQQSCARHSIGRGAQSDLSTIAIMRSSARTRLRRRWHRERLMAPRSPWHKAFARARPDRAYVNRQGPEYRSWQSCPNHDALAQTRFQDRSQQVPSGCGPAAAVATFCKPNRQNGSILRCFCAGGWDLNLRVVGSIPTRLTTTFKPLSAIR